MRWCGDVYSKSSDKAKEYQDECRRWSRSWFRNGEDNYAIVLLLCKAQNDAALRAVVVHCVRVSGSDDDEIECDSVATDAAPSSSPLRWRRCSVATNGTLDSERGRVGVLNAIPTFVSVGN